MQDLNDLYYFVKVIDAGGFAAAGRALSIPKSKLSRRIAALEKRLGVRLIQRTTRRFRVTEIGQTYYNHCNAMLVEANAAQQVIDQTHAEPCGVVRVSCPITLLHVHISQMLADFMVQHPAVKVQLEATNRPVDPVHEGFDLAIRVRPFPLEDSGLVMKTLSDREKILVANPSLSNRLEDLTHPSELTNFPSLAHGSHEESFEWTLHGPNNAEFKQKHSPRFITTDLCALQRAALQGVGIVQLPHLMVSDDLNAGRLVQVLPKWLSKREVIHVVFSSKRGLLPSVRALVDHLAAAYAAFDEQ